MQNKCVDTGQSFYGCPRHEIITPLGIQTTLIEVSPEGSIIFIVMNSKLSWNNSFQSDTK